MYPCTTGLSIILNPFNTGFCCSHCYSFADDVVKYMKNLPLGKPDVIFD